MIYFSFSKANFYDLSRFNKCIIHLILLFLNIDFEM